MKKIDGLVYEDIYEDSMQDRNAVDQGVGVSVLVQF